MVNRSAERPEPKSATHRATGAIITRRGAIYNRGVELCKCVSKGVANFVKRSGTTRVVSEQEMNFEDIIGEVPKQHDTVFVAYERVARPLEEPRHIQSAVTGCYVT